MQRDYYAFQRPRLRPILAALERAAEAFEMAKAANDKNARCEAEEQMKKAAKQAVAIAPHLAYLWFEAFKQEAERRRDEKQGAIFSDGENAVQKAWGSGLTVADSTCDGQQPRDFCKIPDELKFSPAIEDLGRLPRLSFLFVVPFRLRKPYLSKDERDFYLLDNPLRREKVFRTPMVAATGWKGALRSAMVRELVSWWREQDEGERKPEEFAYRRFRLALLFGDEKGEEAGRLEGLAEYLDNVGGEEAAEVFRHKVREYFELKEEDRLSHFRGRLHFFPTFFEKVGLEVINPHDRKTGVGVRGPILMECVPAEAEGMFRLLYVPFGPHAGKEESSPKEAAEDLVAVAEGVRAMLTKYGFGAKTSSGFGVAKGKLPKEWQKEKRWQEVAGRIVLVNAALFSHIVNSNLEVRTSVAIDPKTGAAEEGALFTYEALPRATFLVAEVVLDDYRDGDEEYRGIFPSKENLEKRRNKIEKELIPNLKQEEQNGLQKELEAINQELQHIAKLRIEDSKKWNTPLDVVRAGLRMIEWLGVGGMGTRGFGRLAVVGKPLEETPPKTEEANNFAKEDKEAAQ